MLPEAFLVRMQGMLGGEYEAFLASFEEENHQALRLNALKNGLKGAAYEKPGFTAGLSDVCWAENGYYYEAQMQPGKHPYHDAGVYYIQEPSAMMPAELLRVQPGDRVLDLCAAPGGKSTQLAAKLQGKGFLLCNEIHPARAKILSENVERMGICNACVTNETPMRLAENFPVYFDRILVDAPCSGEGMFRKNDAACGEWSPENVKLCAERQDEILDCAAKMLRPGGRMVYSTCTFAPEEDEGSVERFLERHPEFHAADIRPEELGLAGCEGGLSGTIRLWPHKVKGEGHFAAVLEKEGAMAADRRVSAAGGTVKGLQKRELTEYFAFCRETLKNDMTDVSDMGKYIRFGENLYLVAEDMPAIGGLKVLRPGLHLGELKKNRFEPSHALALALDPNAVLHVWDLSSEDMTVVSYLNGQTFPADGEKGWYLICVDGFSLGWGKLAGGVMKNHYPKGLRRM